MSVLLPGKCERCGASVRLVPPGRAVNRRGREVAAARPGWRWVNRNGTDHQCTEG